jgi:hypothetical protein
MRMPLLSCAERRNPLRPPYGATALLMAAGVQRLAHMAPERRRRIGDLGGELLVRAGDVVPKVEARKIRAQPPSRAWAT